MRHLTAKDLDALALSAAERRDALEAVLRRENVHSAPKTMVKPGDGRLLMSTLAADDESGVMAVKALVQNPANAARGLPYSSAIVLALDAATGQPIATLDGNWITAHRTAALSMLAAKYLARAEAASVAFLGAGVQAQSHLEALAELYPLREVRIHARSAPEALTAMAEAKGLAASQCASAQEAIGGADIVISALSRDTPDRREIDAGWLAPGAFASLVDLGHNWARGPLERLDLLVIDDLAQEASLPEDQRLAPLEAFHGDLGGLARGALHGRQGVDQRAAFLFRGPATGDLALTALALRRAGLAYSVSG